MTPSRAGDDAARSRLLLELSRDVTAHLDLQDVLDLSLRALRQLLDFGGGAIQLIDGNALVARATDPPATPEALNVRIPVGKGVSGTIAATGEPCYIPDITEDPRVYPAGRKAGVSGGVRAYFGVPLILHGHPIGVVQLDSLVVDAFDDADRNLVLSFVPTIAAAVQNAQLFEREVAAVAHLRELERLRSDFLAMVSHELRTPLTAMSGMAQLLASRTDALAPEVLVELAGRIVTNGHRLELLINDLLDLAQIEQGKLAVTCAPTDLGALVADVQRDAELGAHPVSVSVEPGLPLVHADERRTRQIVGNLISNAVKHSPPESNIEIAVRPRGSGVELEVSDTGPGIAPDLHERIFEPFFQEAPASTRTVGGLGVGLHLVRQLADRMGAEVSVDSAPGEGSRFRVRFQLAAPTHRGG